jgi:uncharacterized ferritin-like protein (DUF455 family)
MELRDFATRILHATSLDGKLWRPEGGLQAFTDRGPGEATSWRRPSRPPELEIAPRGQRVSIPSPRALGQVEHRVRVLHAFANHELMALELMAWALLAYPDAPAAFRRGLVAVLFDEQRHLRMYMSRIEAMGAQFGDLPVNDHFWRCAPDLTTPLKWACAMNLTFEQANLDHAPFWAQAFRQFDDEATAAVLERIARDEEEHVAFGAALLLERSGTRDPFEVYRENLTFHNDPARARGPEFKADARRRAGLPDDFVRRLREL